MKKILLLLIAFTMVSCYKNQERNCTEFKTGKFRAEFKVGQKTENMVFERNDSIEIGTYQGKTDTAYVRWVNDCECISQKKNPKNNQEKKSIASKILTTSKNSYTFEFGEVGSDSKQKGTVTKIK